VSEGNEAALMAASCIRFEDATILKTKMLLREILVGVE
jgi:hypothetical protein